MLGEDFDDDVVGNAAALDVYKFLKCQVDQRTLLDGMLEDEPDLRSALGPDPELAESWITASSEK